MLWAVGYTNNNPSGDKDTIKIRFIGITMEKQNLKKFRGPFVMAVTKNRTAIH